MTTDTPTTNPSRFKKAIAAGVIGLSALGASAVLPAVASAHDGGERVQLTEEQRAERQAEREARRAEKVALLTDTLGITEDDLIAAREAGMSLADIAEANGVAIDVLIQAIVDAQTAHIQEHIDAGDIDADKAAERLATLEERVTERVNSEPGERRGHRGRGGFGRGGSATGTADA